MDLNADVAEGATSDFELLPFVTSVNIACGFHAGDPLLMETTVHAAVAAGVSLGAHPGYDDRTGFGRRDQDVEPERLEADLLYQIGALLSFARAHGATLTHVKPHGALYHRADRDAAVAEVVCRAVARAGSGLVLVGPCGAGLLRAAAAAHHLPFAAEAFADRRYDSTGRLLSRLRRDALIADPRAAAEQAVQIAVSRTATAVDGSEVDLRADTLCLHGDTPGATAIARAVRDALHGAGVPLAPLGG